jgi:hypothetical protein
MEVANVVRSDSAVVDAVRMLWGCIILLSYASVPYFWTLYLVQEDSVSFLAMVFDLYQLDLQPCVHVKPCNWNWTSIGDRSHMSNCTSATL